MKTITINNNELSVALPDIVTDIPFSASDLEEMLCLAKSFLQKQTPSEQQIKSARFCSKLTSEIKQKQNTIDFDFFCEALNTISSEMNQHLPGGYDRFENERLCMEFLQLSGNDLKADKVGDLYILSSTKNEDQSTNLSMVISDSLTEVLLSLYDGDPTNSTNVMISSVINQALEDCIRDRNVEKDRMEY